MDALVQNTGAQFDIFDKAVANRAHELMARQFIYRQDYDSFKTDYNQLANFARRNSDVAYVARQWADEEPRYRWVDSALQQKIRSGNPANYDTRISISSTNLGCCDGCSGDSKIPILPYSPVGNYGTGYIPTTGRAGGSQLVYNSAAPTSLGDMFRDLFGRKAQPTITGNDSQLIDESGIFTGIITALIIGAIFYVIHLITKGKLSV